jgi:hypothetical protein
MALLGWSLLCIGVTSVGWMVFIVWAFGRELDKPSNITMDTAAELDLGLRKRQYEFASRKELVNNVTNN